MGLRVGLPQRKSTLKLEEYQTMTVEAEEEQCTKDMPEKHKQKLKAICGMADLRNEAVGLYNIGLSCCLNSLLQVFFMNRHFTTILRRIKVPFEAAEQKASVPYQMLLLLEQMQQVKKKSVLPSDLACCLSLHNVRLFVLYDASQLFLILWNLIKSQIINKDLKEDSETTYHLVNILQHLTGKSWEETSSEIRVNMVESLTALYTIQLQEFLVCQECLLETKKDSNMLVLPLPLFDCGSYLEDALRCFFAPEQLTGDNACCCERCDKKTPCLQGMKVMALPKTLMLQLKRFHSKEGSRTHKIGHSVSFPLSLDFSQILTPEQYCSDSLEKDNGLYELFAVVAHSGSASFGHYCAYIWSLTEHKWYCFNDSSVCQVSWDDVKCTYGNAGLHWGETAYLLVYMKKNHEQL